MATRNIFERKEKKYVLSEAQAQALLSVIADKIEPDEYPESNIKSTYYDTPDSAVIQRSLEKPVYKEKLRIRDYGCGSVFVELKKKFDGIVYKRRVEVSKKAYHAWIDGNVPFAEAYDAYPIEEGRVPSKTDIQIAAEVDEFRRRYGNLSKSVGVAVFRRSWRERGVEDGVRITMDFNLVYTDLRSQDCILKSLTDGVVMELKISGAYPVWLAHTLSQLKIFPTSFSKYGTAYKEMASRKAISQPSTILPNQQVATARRKTGETGTFKRPDHRGLSVNIPKRYDVSVAAIA